MKRIATILILTALGTAPLCAMPSQITFQGTLKQQGVPVNTTKNLQFSFVDGTGATIPGTTPISIANVQVTNGLFAVQLPIDPTVNWQAYSPFIQVSVEGQSLAPNQPLTSNVYSIVSQTVVDGAIGTSKIANQAVTTGQIATQAVTTAQIADLAVTAAKLDPSVQGITVPSGLIALFAGPCPAGWSRFSSLDNTFPMGGASYGSIGGAATHMHSISIDGTHHHTLIEHNEVSAGSANTVGVSAAGSSLGAFSGGGGSTVHPTDDTTTDAGAHNHGGVTGPASSLPPYLTVVFCQKV